MRYRLQGPLTRSGSYIDRRDRVPPGTRARSLGAPAVVSPPARLADGGERRVPLVLRKARDPGAPTSRVDSLDREERPLPDRAAADPPTETLADLPAAGIVVWAVIYSPVESNPPPRPIRLDLSKARHLECCDGPVSVAGGDDELTGYGPGRAYSVIVRIYFGAPPTRSLRTQAQRAVNDLRLPTPR